MKKALLITVAVVFGFLGASAAWGQASAGALSVVNRSGAPVDADRIIRTFASKEEEFRTALNNYSFKRDAVIQTIAFGGQISGEYHRVSRFVFDDSGRRFEKILRFPIPTITEITITPEDLEDLGGVQIFSLSPARLHEYEFVYIGKERIDELDLHVFDVTPKILSDKKRLKEIEKSKTPIRFFKGRVWVDDRDFQVVKARGKGVPEVGDQRFPTFETYRENIDGRYWFPTYTYADDELVFKSGQVVRLRMLVKFTDFERLKGKARVIEEGDPGDIPEEFEKPQTNPAPAPTPGEKRP